MNELDLLCINTIKTLAVDAVQKADSGHPGLPMGAAVMAYTLWTKHLRHNPKNPEWADRDRFVLSAGHGSMLLYSLLHLTGYDLSLDEIKRFRQWGSQTPGHPESILTPGVEATTGPLGQGTGNAVGMALAEKYLAAYFNTPDREIVNHTTYSIVSDGDLMEGISSEVSSLAGHLKLGKLIFLYDDNKITIDGSTSLSFSENTSKRYEAYGWHVQDINGMDMAEVDNALNIAKDVTDRPSFINCKTTIGAGSPNKAGTSKVHGSPLGPDEIKLFKASIGWPEEDFYIPEAALNEFRKAVDRGAELESEWNKKYESWGAANPELAMQWRDAQSGQLPHGYSKDAPTFTPADGKIATRTAFGKALNATTSKMGWLIGGSADLAGSTDTDILDSESFSSDNHLGRILHWGIREHAMGATMNGIMLHKGLRVFGSTFFVFSDYMRPSVRLAALSEINPVYIWTHDSIGLGEDGPTHQPIEHMAAVRAIPNLAVIRPSDANETTYAWLAALSHKEGPSALILTRQKLPVIDREKYANAENLSKGAYILAGSPTSTPDVIIMATGSEVTLALGAYERLVKDGIAARVVSMPCWEFFETQSDEYKEQVLPKSVKARLSVEMATSFGWSRYVGDEGENISIDRFGASAPIDDLLFHFGFTPDHVYEKAKALAAKWSKTTVQ